MKYQIHPISIDESPNSTPGNGVIGVKLSSMNFNYFSPDVQFQHGVVWQPITHFNEYKSENFIDLILLDRSCHCLPHVNHWYNIISYKLWSYRHLYLWHKYILYWIALLHEFLLKLFFWKDIPVPDISHNVLLHHYNITSYYNGAKDRCKWWIHHQQLDHI